MSRAFTVKRMMALPELAELRLVEPGDLEREVTCVTTQDAPWSHAWLRGGEFVLTSGYAVQSGVVAVEPWLQTMIDRGVAGIGIMEGFLHVLTEAAHRLAKESSLPVVAVPQGMPYAWIMRAVYAALSVPQNAGVGEGRLAAERRLAQINAIQALFDAGDATRNHGLDVAGLLGIDLSPPLTVLAVQVDTGADALPSGWRMPPHVERAAESAGMRLLVENLMGETIAVGRIQTDDLLGTLLSLHSCLVSAIRPLTACIGVSRLCHETAQLSRHLREARRALLIGRRLYGSNKLLRFDDLGIFRLFSTVDDEAELRRFRDEYLGVLGALPLAEDIASLKATLATYLRNNQSLSPTARQLYVHHNTVLYRLGKVQRLLGISLKDARSVLRLQLALEIDAVLSPRT